MTVHHFVRQRFAITGNHDLFLVGDRLDRLGRLRAKADYEIAFPGKFAASRGVTQAVADATAALARLGAIDADPAIQAAVVAASRAAFP